MPRHRRWHATGVAQLVQLRGHNAQPLFRRDNDYRHFQACLAEAALEGKCAVHAFALLPTEVALLVTPAEAGASSTLVQSVGRGYVPYYNRTYQRSGALWSGRYRAAAVDPESSLLSAQRFVDSLPERRGIAPRAPAPQWTGFSRARDSVVAQFVRPHSAYLALGPNSALRAERYAQLLAVSLSSRLVSDIEMALVHSLAVGPERFKDWLAAISGARVRLGKPGRPRRRGHSGFSPERLTA